jgi:hypothetical protein
MSNIFDDSFYLNNKVIPIWVIIYDSDINKSYYFTNSERAFGAVDGAVRTYVDDDSPVAKDICDEFMGELKQRWGQPCVPAQFNDLQIAVYNFKIDKYNELHDVLIKCYNKIDDMKLKDEISRVFVDDVVAS